MVRKKAKTFDEMDTTVLICRVGRHMMDLDMAMKIRIDRRQGLEYHWVCDRCGTLRLDRVMPLHRERRIELVSRQYVHPDGYIIEKVEDWGGRKVFNSNVQYELFVRYFESAKEVKKKK